MKKFLTFFIGLIILLLTFATLYFSGALYDVTNQRNIQAFVMQPNNLSNDRIGRPVALDGLSDKFVRDRLIKKFVYEYFYVTPDVEDIARRTRSNSIMAAISHPDVFKEWKSTEADIIENMAGKKMLRNVVIADEIIMQPDSDYWEVYYELRTWSEPNNMELQPDVQTGIMFVKILFEKGVREQRGGQKFDAQKYLNDGGDPAAIFKFRVDEVRGLR